MRAQPVARDDRVLMLSEHVLQLVGRPGKTRRALAENGSERLAGVADALRLDTHGMELLARRRSARSPRGAAKTLPRAVDRGAQQLRGGSVRGRETRSLRRIDDVHE